MARKGDIKWKYEIGEHIIKGNLNITIIDRRLTPKHQEYKIRCNICGFDSGKHYNVRKKIYRDEYWVIYCNLQKMVNCPCCQGIKKIIVKGINDISTTDTWMK